MKYAIYVDAVNHAIDNSMQWKVMGNLGRALSFDHDVKIIDPKKIGKEAALQQLKLQNYDLLLTYNKTGTDLHDSKGKIFLPQLEVPQVTWLVEHPVTFFKQYQAADTSRRHYILTNPQHNFFVKEMGLLGSTSELLFGAEPVEKYIPYNRRPFDICIAAQWRGSAETNAFWLDLPARQRKFFEDVNALQQLEHNGDVFTAFYAAAEHYRVPLDRIKNYADYIKALYWYARKAERIKLVQDLVASGLKILLIGDEKWKSVLPEHQNVLFLPSCDAHELRSYYQKSKAVAAINCYNGANERTFETMACGAISISEDSPTLMRQFTDGYNLLFYPRLKADLKMEYFIEIISDIAAGEAIAARGQRSFLKAHTWKHRAESLNAQIQPLLGIDNSKL